MKVRTILMVLAAAVLIAGASARPSFAQQDTLITGIYQCTGTGFVTPVLNGATVPFTSIGNIDADGAGDFATTNGLSAWTLNVLGFPFQQVHFASNALQEPESLGYVIEPDGEGDAQISFTSTLLSELLGAAAPLAFQNFVLGVSGIGLGNAGAGVAEQFTMTAEPNVGLGTAFIQFPNTWVIVCNHQ